MKLIIVVNSTLSTTQKTIQAAHVVAKLAHTVWKNNRSLPPDLSELPIVLFDGGNHAQLDEFLKIVVDHLGPYNWSSFREDESMNQQLTAVALYVPNQFGSESGRQELVQGFAFGWQVAQALNKLKPTA